MLLVLIVADFVVGGVGVVFVVVVVEVDCCFRCFGCVLLFVVVVDWC